MKSSQKARTKVLRQLEAIYAPLQKNEMRIFAAFMESTIEFENSYGIDHCFLRRDGYYDGACYPLPVFTIPQVCDIFINVGSIDFYAYLPSELPSDVLKRFHIKEKPELQHANGYSLFRMAEDEDDAIVLGFAEELRKVGAYI